MSRQKFSMAENGITWTWTCGRFSSVETARSLPFYNAAKVRPSASGLTLSETGQGFAVFEVRSPYVIVPLVGDLDTTADDREASVVRIDATSATLSLSLDNGLTWRELGNGNGSLDLTPQVSGIYGYLLKITLRGEPEKALVRSLELTTWVQVHPASLPALRKGKNEMRFVSGDHYGLPTRANVAFAKLAMTTDLGFSEAVFGFGAHGK